MPIRYPKDDDPNVSGELRLPIADVYLQDTHRLTIPVSVKDSIENCYLTGAGVADFTDDPPLWDLVVPVKFSLRLRSQSPLELDDVYTDSAVASVGLAHVDHDTAGVGDTDSVLALDTVDVSVQTIKDKDNATKAEVWLDIMGAYWGDCWMDKIAFRIGLLVFRPSFLIPPPKFIPRHLPIQDLIGLVQPLRGQM
jgi:hypothetical protein